jgi:hypothetical protein
MRCDTVIRSHFHVETSSELFMNRGTGVGMKANQTMQAVMIPLTGLVDDASGAGSVLLFGGIERHSTFMRCFYHHDRDSVGGCKSLELHGRSSTKVRIRGKTSRATNVNLNFFVRKT